MNTAIISDMLLSTLKFKVDSVVNLFNFVRAHESQYAPGEYQILLLQAYNLAIEERIKLDTFYAEHSGKPGVEKILLPALTSLYEIWDWGVRILVVIDL